MLQTLQRVRLQVWFVRVCSCVLVWTCLSQLVAVGDLWRGHSRLPVAVRFFLSLGNDAAVSSFSLRDPVPASPPYVPLRVYKSNGYLRISCNGGLNQMRSEVVLATQLFFWAGQFVGHGVFEKLAPALLDNLSQALMMAPFFDPHERFRIRTISMFSWKCIKEDGG